MHLFSGSILGAIMVLAPSLLAAVPEAVSIRKIEHFGSGCPIGSDEVHVRYDGETQSLHLILPNMVAEIGPQISLSHSRLNCLLNIDMEVPEGWQYAFVDLKTRGSVELEEGIRGEVSLTQNFQGAGNSLRYPTIFDGPRDKDFVINDFIDLDSQLWSPCDRARNLNFNIAARLHRTQPALKGFGLMELGTHWGGHEWSMRLQWRRCSP